MANNNDLIITNARVITSDPMNPRAEAVVVRGNQILYAGNAAQAKTFQNPATRLIDGQGCTLMPGFIDCHFHLQLGSLELANIQLGEVRTFDNFKQTVRRFAENHPEKDWLAGYGLLYSIELPGERSLDRHLLDEMVADRPLAVVAYDGHTAWANSLALERAGILNGAETPPGNEIVMAPDGFATGELREPGAFNFVFDLIPEPDEAEKRELLRKGLALAAQAGVTSVHNMDGDYEQITRHAALEKAGEMTLRVYLPFSVKPGMALETLQEAQAMKRDFQGDLVRGGCAKFFMDGVLESYTALLVEPYEGKPGFRGEAQYSLEEFTQLAGECDRLGLQIFVHACGDGAVRRALDGYQVIQKATPKKERRHRIEHIEVIHPDDLPRFAQMGVIASMQPLHAPLDVKADPDPWPSRVGQWRWPRSFAWRYLRQAGALLVFGSDWSVVSMNPLLGVYAALNRHPWAEDLPDHRQTLDETIISYTRDAAYAEFQEQRKGQLKAGMLADMVLLSGDLQTTPAEELAAVHPLMTICDGRVVYED